MDPDICWGIGGASELPKLANIAQIAFTIPISQAVSEGIWNCTILFIQNLETDLQIIKQLA